MTQKSLNFFKRKSFNRLGEIIKFTLVGGFCLCCGTLILYFCLEVLKFHYLIATIIGFVLSNLLGFFLNKYYTFQAKNTKIWKELYKYYTVMTSSFIANLGMMFIFVDIFKIWAVYASLIVAVIFYIYNYLMHKNWSFKIK
jgi:putative flippase GtrA